MELLCTRRKFLAAGLLASAGQVLGASASPGEKIIDIHQHTHYHGRSDADLIAHQRAMGITHTVLLPAGSLFGLEADCWGNESVRAVYKRLPGEFSIFANEVPDLPGAAREIRKYLNKGAIGIGEQKFYVGSDSKYIDGIAEVAREFNVPILLHFWDGDYNVGFKNFHKTLEKFPTVSFIGHAQTWWANVDANYDQKTTYPKGKIAKGGLTEKYLADYPNMYGDLSAGSGLNALTRDPDFTASFLERHQQKLMFGSDCADVSGKIPECDGAKILAAVREHTNAEVRERIFHANAKRVLRLRHV